MKTFKKMKMRINNPEHSKAVQEWLFEQGYEWSDGKEVFESKFSTLAFLFTGSDTQNSITFSGQGEEEHFKNSPHEEVNVQHLDPHLFTVHKSSKVPAKSFTAKPQQSTFDNMLKNLKHVQKAIEMADNKQSKRLKDRDRMMSKINEMLPEGFVVSVAGEEAVKFDPEEIVVGSIWECVKEDMSSVHQDCTKGITYSLYEVSPTSVDFIDDAGDEVTMYKESFRKHFKRIS